MIAITNSQMRECDRYTIDTLGVPSQTLMRRAGTAIADEVERVAKRLKTDDILVVCGTGNNGGDGYVCADELKTRGFDVKIYAFEGRFSPDCEAFRNLTKCRYLRHITGLIIVDCIFGTGLGREVEGEFKQVIEEINSSGAFVISADIPSGLNGDNGLVCGIAVKADLTVAIAQYKTGMFLNDGIDYCGKIVLKDIGIFTPQDGCVEIADNEQIKKYYPTRARNSHKGTYGSATIVAGSEKYAGAAALSLKGALRSGCGYTKLLSCEYVRGLLIPKLPQVIYLDEIELHSNAIAVGMGMGATKETYQVVQTLLKNYEGYLIVDADGINVLSEFGIDILKEKKCNVILTPHIKEFSRLTNLSVSEILNNPIEIAKNFSKEYGVTLLLKSSASIITDGDRVTLNIKGTTALSKGGSGDILSGFMCGSLARGLSPFDGAVCAAYTLGVAAEIASEEKTDYCATADDIIKNLHFSVKRLTSK